MDRVEKAKEYFMSGYNCSSSVVLAFKDLIEIDEEQLKKISIPFGGGLGRQRLTCGAVFGMCMVLGLLLSDGQDKLSIYSIIQSACDEFKTQVGSITCRELLEGNVKVDTNPTPEERTAEYYKKRPCVELVALAVEITNKYITK